MMEAIDALAGRLQPARLEPGLGAASASERVAA